MEVIKVAIGDALLTSMWVFSLPFRSILTSTISSYLGFEAKSFFGLLIGINVATLFVLSFASIGTILGGASSNPTTTLSLYAAGLKPGASLLSLAIRLPAQAAGGADSACQICPDTQEHVLHVLRDCIEAQGLWREILPTEKCSLFFSMNYTSWLSSNLINASELVFGIPWCVLFSTCCWMLWKWRNERVFNGSLSLRKANQVRITACEFFKIHAALQGNSRASDLGNLLVSWAVPTDGMVKINTDGAVLGDEKKASAGGVIRNSQGDWLAGFVTNLGHCTVIESELWGILLGLQLCWSKGWKNVILETDSSTAISLIHQDQHSGNRHQPLIQAIRRLLSKDWRIQLQHVFRESNKVADWLAASAMSFPLGTHVLDTAPNELLELLRLDAGVIGPSLNPANAYGWAYVNNWHNTWELFYVYWISPFIGSIFAGLVCRLLFKAPTVKEKEA